MSLVGSEASTMSSSEEENDIKSPESKRRKFEHQQQKISPEFFEEETTEDNKTSKKEIREDDHKASSEGGEEGPLQQFDAVNSIVLPYDILLSIFFLSFSSSIDKPNAITHFDSPRRNKKNYSLVCRHWCDIINSRSLWISLLRIIDYHYPVPSSTIALQKLVITYHFDQVTKITDVWNHVSEVLVNEFKYDPESMDDEVLMYQRAIAVHPHIALPAPTHRLHSSATMKEIYNLYIY